jgi:hypothetical protein
MEARHGKESDRMVDKEGKRGESSEKRFFFCFEVKEISKILSP